MRWECTRKVTGPFGDPTENKHSDSMVSIWLEKGLFETNGLKHKSIHAHTWKRNYFNGSFDLIAYDERLRELMKDTWVVNALTVL